MARKKGSPKTGGRAAGVKNKNTAEIKEIIDKIVDFDVLIQKLYNLSIGPKQDPVASKLLLEYRFGKPTQQIDNNITFSKPVVINWSDDPK